MVDAVLWPDGVVGTVNASVAVRLRLVGNRYGPSETTITSLVGRYNKLLVNIKLSAVEGRAYFVAVININKTKVPRLRGVTTRGTLVTADIPAVI